MRNASKENTLMIQKNRAAGRERSEWKLTTVKGRVSHFSLGGKGAEFFPSLRENFHPTFMIINNLFHQLRLLLFIPSLDSISFERTFSAAAATAATDSTEITTLHN